MLYGPPAKMDIRLEALGKSCCKILNMPHSVRQFVQNPFIKYTSIAAVLMLAIQLGILWFGIMPSTEPIFLHYTTYLGVDLLGAWYMVYWIPLATAVIAVCNNFAAYLLVVRDRVLAYFLSFAAAVAALLLTAQAALIVIINS